MSNKTFQKVGSLKPSRSVFDLSYSKVFDCDMGELIPVMCDEMVPGDHFTINNEMVIRLQPMLAPILHEIYITTHYYFVPYRLLWDQFEEFITGGREGDFAGNPPLLSDSHNSFNFEKRSLPDYLGFPLGDIPMTVDNAPSSFPVSAYNLIYNEYYRDENLQDEVELDNTDILITAWTKDYFTSALPWIQRGTVPALPVQTDLDGVVETAVTTTIAPDGSFTLGGFNFGQPSAAGLSWQRSSGTAAIPYGAAYTSGLQAVSTAASDATLTAISTAFNVNDLRLAFQISKWQERNARAGIRYVEFLYSHFGVSPRDERLQRPEYIGGTRSPVIVSEVLQTSSTDSTTPQGNMAGHGISVDSTHVGRYTAREFGLVMGILKIHPKPSYMPQGVNRQWRRLTRFDYYFREFANLGEQGILNNEIYTQGSDSDKAVFGFQGRYDEMRVKNNMVCANMRDVFSYWHLARSFASLPLLNEQFIECIPDKRIFAVPSEPGFIVHYANRVKAVRPLPILAEPGLIDHF